jgi:hypothetical protein
MFSSKLILVALTVLGLGGFGVAAASGDAKVADGTGAMNTAVMTVDDIGGDQDVPDLIVNGDAGLNLNTTVSSSLTSTLELSGSVRPAIAIATAFSTTLTDVIQLHDSGWGFGEIYKLYDLARLTGMTPAQIQALRDSGLGWGQIEAQLGVKHGNHGDNLGGIVSGRTLTSTTSTSTVKNSTNRGVQSRHTSQRTLNSRITQRNSQSAVNAKNAHNKPHGRR